MFFSQQFLPMTSTSFSKLRIRDSRMNPDPDPDQGSGSRTPSFSSFNVGDEEHALCGRPPL
jgi:hypothetical protein